VKLPNHLEEKKRTSKDTEIVYLTPEEKNNTLIGKKYFIKTYGCQMNVHDSEELCAHLENLGLSRTDVLEDSDVIVLNTCAIRENAHEKVFGYLGRCKHLKHDKPNVIVVLCGCMAQEESVASEIKNKHPYVDIVIGTHNISVLPKKILECMHKQDIDVLSNEGNVYENIPYKRDSKVTAWVNIMYGCDKFCTYCIVPYTRGKQRSRLLKDIIKEINCLVNNGYKEVTLLGQNVNAYGKDLNDGTDFATLLQAASDTGIERLRFVTSHPWDFTDEMIDVIASNKNIMPYIHLPLQSGSSRILKIMGRRYSKEEYLNLFDKMKKRIPNVSITTDIIVGFPNETDDDFKETLDVVNYCKYDGAYTFIYSPREGTPAAKMKDTISLETKEKRLQELNELVNKYSNMNNQKYLNKVVPVLIIGKSDKDDTKVMGYTDTMKLVNVVADDETIGNVINVLITDAKSFSLDGKMVK
jgi:tRNA-2-methylthio-N6-dimethylallyladenosine synthase